MLPLTGVLALREVPQKSSKSKGPFSFPGHSLAVGAPKPGVEGAALDQNLWQSLQAPEDIYDDVEELQDRL